MDVWGGSKKGRRNVGAEKKSCNNAEMLKSNSRNSYQNAVHWVIKEMIRNNSVQEKSRLRLWRKV